MKHHTIHPPKKPTKHTGKGTVGNLGTLFIGNGTISLVIFVLQSNLPYVTFQRNNEIWSHKAGGRLIQI
jgi:hypothetical protein